MFFITENTCHVLCNFSSVEFSEFNEKIQIGKTQYRAATQLDGQVQYLPFMANKEAGGLYAELSRM